MEAQGWRDSATLAREAGIGPSTLRKIVTGERPTAEFATLDALASVLDVGVTALGRPLEQMWVVGPDGPEPLARRVARQAAGR